MKTTRICTCGNKEIEISNNTYVAIRYATSDELNVFEKSHWNWPDEIPFDVSMWESLCQTLTGLKSYLISFDTDNSEIWNKCLKAFGLDSGGKCSFEFIPIDDNNSEPKIIISVTYSHSVKLEDEWGQPVKDSDGNFKYETIYTHESKECRYPCDFWTLLNITENHLAGLMKGEKLSKVKYGMERCLLICNKKDKWKRRKNNLNLLNFVDLNTSSIQKFNKYMTKYKNIINRKDFKEFCQLESHRVLDVDGEVFFEFGNDCGFDIDEKRTEIHKIISEIEESLELTRQKLMAQNSDRIKKSISQDSDKIKDEFYQEKLLANSSLSTSEKLKEFKRLEEFCIKHFPKLKDENFKTVKLSSEYLDNSTINAFRQDWDNLTKSIRILTRGLKGEEKLSASLKLLEDQGKLLFLKNYTYENFEHDFVILATSGVFTVEVKTLHGNHIITETGLMKNKETDIPEVNVAEQSMRHAETLRKILNECSVFKDKPITEIVCSADDRYTLKSDFPYINVCYPTTIRNVLFSSEQKNVFTKKELMTMKKHLEKNRAKEVAFDLFKPKGELSSREDFILNFAKVAACRKYL